MRRFAFFLSSHGFGHAARAAAVIESMHALDPGVGFEIFTQTPSYFFRESLAASFVYHEIRTDIGLVQRTPLVEDLQATLRLLDQFLPFPNATLAELAKQVLDCGCRAIVCDIAPLGLAVAKLAGIPSVLLENFTWDWIYEGYAQDAPSLRRHIDYLRDIFYSATFHVQCEPVCNPSIKAALVTAPISREPRTSASEIRRQLGIPDSAKVLLVSMGGIPLQLSSFDRLQDLDGWHCIIPGGAPDRRTLGNLVLLPHHSNFYHPDLVRASHAAIGKAGYSTVAEAYHAGLPFSFIHRPQFRESEVMASFITKEMAGVEMPQADFYSGNWSIFLSGLNKSLRKATHRINGAEAVASFILDRVR